MNFPLPITNDIIFQWLQPVADSSSSLVVVKNLDHQYVLVNQAFADAVGKPKSEIIGKDELQLSASSDLVMADGAEVKGIWKLDDDAVKFQSPTTADELAIVGSTGSRRAIRTTRYPLHNDKGQTTHLLCVSVDRTESVDQMSQATMQEKYFKAILDLSPGLMYVKDSQDRYIFTNKAMNERIGVDSDGLKNKTYAEVTGDTKGFQAIKESDRSVLENESLIVEDEFDTSLLNRGGNRIYKSFKRSLALHSDQPDHIIGLMIDISDHKEALRLLETELARTEALSKLSNALHNSDNVQTVLDTACRLVVDACNAKIAVICETCEQGGVRISATANSQTEANNTETRDVLSAFEKIVSDKSVFEGSLSNWCIQHKQPVLITKAHVDSRMSEDVQRERQRTKIGASLHIPLLHRGEVWGLVTAHRDVADIDFTDEDLNLINAIGNQVSVALHRQKLTAHIEHQAYHDMLTRLPNRLKFEDTLNNAVNEASLNQTTIAILFFDLDGFKSVNDVFGHALGDELLIAMSARLNELIPSNHLLARMGGDEFAVLLRDLNDHEQAVVLSRQIIDVLSGEYFVEGVSIKLGASVGISYYPDDCNNAGDLLKNADFAMYQAKGDGKNRVQCFSREMADRYKDRLNISKELSNAISLNELRLVYQPKVCVATNSVVGVEALLRWNQIHRGEVSPGEFIPVAEESGLIIPIGSWVVKQACQQLVEWHNSGMTDLTVAVNVSAQQFTMESFVDTIEKTLDETGLDPRYLELEVTESLVMVDVDRTVEKLLKLKSLGVKVSVDDFGTGFSSLRYLDDLPLDYLKIDRSFIQNIGSSNPRISLVETIIAIAKAFELQTIAEGVETEEQLHKVTNLGCDYIQGFLFSKPVEADQLPDTVNSIESPEPENAVAV